MTFSLDFQDQRFQLLVEMPAIAAAGLQQLGQGRGLAVGEQPGKQFAQVQYLGQGRPVCLGRRLPGDGIAQRFRKVPLLQQPGRQLRVRETHGSLLDRAKIEAMAHGPIEKSGIRLSQLLEEQEYAQVVEQARQEGFVAGNPPQTMAQFPAGDRLGQRVLPIPQERLRLDIQEQPAGQAESQHQEFQRLDSQQGQGLVEVRHLAAEPEKRTIDHAEDSAGNCRIVLDALFQGPRIDVGVPRQLQDLHGNGRADYRVVRAVPPDGRGASPYGSCG